MRRTPPWSVRIVGIRTFNAVNLVGWWREEASEWNAARAFLGTAGGIDEARLSW
jgi:hypothetical protein